MQLLFVVCLRSLGTNDGRWLEAMGPLLPSAHDADAEADLSHSPHLSSSPPPPEPLQASPALEVGSGPSSLPLLFCSCPNPLL